MVVADGREVQEAVPHQEGARDRLLHAGMEEAGHRRQMYPEVLSHLHQVGGGVICVAKHVQS